VFTTPNTRSVRSGSALDPSSLLAAPVWALSCDCDRASLGTTTLCDALDCRRRSRPSSERRPPRDVGCSSSGACRASLFVAAAAGEDGGPAAAAGESSLRERDKAATCGAASISVRPSRSSSGASAASSLLSSRGGGAEEDAGEVFSIERSSEAAGGDGLSATVKFSHCDESESDRGESAHIHGRFDGADPPPGR
jgi:hypothetical protein